jgi:hypothetical protein
LKSGKEKVGEESVQYDDAIVSDDESANQITGVAPALTIVGSLFSESY